MQTNGMIIDLRSRKKIYTSLYIIRLRRRWKLLNSLAPTLARISPCLTTHSKLSKRKKKNFSMAVLYFLRRLRHAKHNPQRLLQMHNCEGMYKLHHSVVLKLNCTKQEGSSACNQNSTIHFRSCLPISSGHIQHQSNQNGYNIIMDGTHP